MSHLYIIVPTYNEAQIIGSVIEEIQRAGYSNIIVVDDGSDDDIGKKLESYHIQYLRHMINRGKGAAIKTGIEAAKILGATAVITMDGDGQHNPADIHKMLDLLGKGYDVVLGSRLIHSKGMPFIKVVANHVGNFFTWLIYGLWVTDSQSGFRAYSRRALDLIDTKHDRYEYDSEIIREIHRHRLKYAEIPIEVRYTEYSMSKKQKQSFINGLRTLLKLVLSA